MIRDRHGCVARGRRRRGNPIPLLLFALLALVACGGDDQRGAATPRALLDHLADAFERRDREAVLAAFDRSTPDGDRAARLIAAFLGTLEASDRLEAAVKAKFGAKAAAAITNEGEARGFEQIPARLRETEIEGDGDRVIAGRMLLVRRDGVWLAHPREPSDAQRAQLDEKRIARYETATRVYGELSALEGFETFEKFNAALLARILALNR